MPAEKKKGFWAQLDQELEFPLSKVLLGIVMFIVLILAWLTCVVTVDAGHVGVVKTFGSVTGTMSPGINFKAPWQGVEAMSVQTQNIDMVGKDDASSLTIEGVAVNIDCTTLYQLDADKATSVYTNLGQDYQDRIVVPEIRGALRDEIAKYRAEDIYSSERGAIAQAVINDLNDKLAPQGIKIQDFIIRQVVLPQTLQDSILAKQSAEQQIVQQQYQLNITELKAQQRIAEARGIAESQKIIDATLTEAYLRHEAITELYANKNVTIITAGDGLGLAKVV